MPEIRKILESERERKAENADSLYAIDLYLDGTFWRAYEWSAQYDAAPHRPQAGGIA